VAELAHHHSTSKLLASRAMLMYVRRNVCGVVRGSGGYIAIYGASGGIIRIVTDAAAAVPGAAEFLATANARHHEALLEIVAQIREPGISSRTCPMRTPRGSSSTTSGSSRSRSIARGSVPRPDYSGPAMRRTASATPAR
jgi:hypothetical protein